MNVKFIIIIIWPGDEFKRNDYLILWWLIGVYWSP